MEWLQKNTKTRGADKYENIPKHSVEMMHKSMKKSIPELNKKRCLKTDAKKAKNTQKMTPKSVPKDDFISGVAPLGAPLTPEFVLFDAKNAL